MAENIMRKECVTIVITKTVEQKSPGNASMKNYTQTDFAKIVI